MTQELDQYLYCLLDMETQAVPPMEDSIQSFTNAPSSPVPARNGKGVVMPHRSASKSVKGDDSLECECGVTVSSCSTYRPFSNFLCETQIEDSDCIYCDGGCDRWFHAWYVLSL